jgi:glycosyltransferase involved in cell wall biosynthesis
MSSDLVVFGEDWGGLPSSTQHLMGHLSDSRKILWVNSIGLRKPRLNMADCGRALQKLTSRGVRGHRGTTIPSPGFTVLSPKTIPAPSTRLARSMAAALLQNQLLRAMEKAGLHKPILWISLPTASDLVGKLGEKAAVYYCGDDFSALAGVDHLTVATREGELQHKADLIIAASERLAERFPAPKTRLLTHGVDYQLFSTPAPRATDLPDDGKPIAGFYGSISDWLDLELLEAVVKRMPHWNFVMIGKAVVDTSALRCLPNVNFLGPRLHHELPRYSQHWNASLLPFRNNAQIQACNPLKLSEYLAAGKPVVSTPFPALKPFRSLISVADSVNSMVAALEGSVSLARDGEFQEKSRSVVSSESWQSRAALVGRWLDSI